MNKVIVITGGARGIGKTLVENFAKQGNIVAFTYLTSVTPALELQENLNKNGYNVYCEQVDISIDSDIDRFISNVWR